MLNEAGRFSDPEKLIADLKDMGIRVVPIVDPGVKKDPEYTIYQEGVREDNFCKYLEGWLPNKMTPKPEKYNLVR